MVPHNEKKIKQQDLSFWENTRTGPYSKTKKQRDTIKEQLSTNGASHHLENENYS